MVNKNSVGEIGEYVLCLGYAALVVKTICGKLEKKLLLGDRASRAVVIGFDDGDYIVLDEIRS